MTWPTHAAGGVAALWLLAPLPGALTPQGMGLMAATAALGALLPDMDAGRSKITSAEVAGVRPLLPLSLALRRALGHRGPLHSLPGLLLFALLVALPLSAWWGVGPAAALCLGYGSHLALDACTVRGVPLLPARGGDGRWGFAARYHLLPRGLRVVTGSPAEDPVFLLLAAAALLLLVRTLLY